MWWCGACGRLITSISLPGRVVNILCLSTDWHSNTLIVDTTPGLEVRSFLTGKGRRRVKMKETIDSIKENGGRTWVYISGPGPFIEAGEKACRRSGVDFFGARWA